MAGCVIKVSHDGDFRRFRFTAGLAALREKIASLYPAHLGGGTEFTLLYTDEDGDKITIAEDADLELATSESNGVLKLQIAKVAPAGSVRHPCHGCPLTLSASETPWICDGVDRRGGCRNGEHHGDLRWRCTAGCDFDLCQACLDDPRPDMLPPAGNIPELIRNLRDTLAKHGIECSVDLGNGPAFNSGGSGCPVRGMCGGHGRGRGRRGRRGCGHRRHHPSESSSSPATTDGPEVADAGATADVSAAHTVPDPSAPVPPASVDAAPVSEPRQAADFPAPEPWAGEVQLLQDMGLRATPTAMRASLDRHKGAIGAVISDLLNNS